DDRDERLAVRFTGSEKTQHSRFILSEVFATSGATHRDLFSDPPGSCSCTTCRHDRTTDEREDAMRLVADRFVEEDDGRVGDLATGERVLLTMEAAGDTPSQRQWAVRCDALQKLQHHRIVQLVDFGAIGSSARFEAWKCGAIWPGARQEAQHASN